MATVQEMFTDVLLRYRHSYTDAQMTVWFNEIETELFEMFEIDSEPYSFELVADTYLYPIPTGVEVEKIKVMSIQIDDGNPPNFEELPFKRNDNNELADESQMWYTIVSDNFYINISDITAGRDVYIYLDKSPTIVVSTSLGVNPSTPLKYQGLLKYRLLQRIAESRKDVIFANNFMTKADTIESDLVWNQKMNEPEWNSPADTMPRPGRNRQYERAIWITQV